MSTETYKTPKTYKLEVGESTGEQSKLGLSTDNNLDLASTFSQEIWVHDLSHPLIAAFLDSIGVLPVRLGSKINEIFTVVINDKFWKSFIAKDINSIQEKDYYLEELAQSYCQSSTQENSQDCKKYLQNPEVISLSDNLTKLTKLVILLTNLMEKHDNILRRNCQKI